MNRTNFRVALEGKNISKEYNTGETTTSVLKNISLQIDRGDFVSIMGPSGSGKSTLLYILSGLDEPTGGTVYINGEQVSKLDDNSKSILRRRNIGFVFQFYNLIPNLSVEENIMLPVLLDGEKLRDYRVQLNNILDVVGLSDRRTHTPRELSGGQQQRVAIARALINDPDIIFADEPIGNLDTTTGKEIMELLKEINLDGNKTIVMVTHSEDSAKYSNRIINVRDGVVS